MPNAEVHHSIGPVLGAAVRRLLDAAERATGSAALSDHLAIDLARGGGAGFVAVTWTDDASGDVVGYAQATQANESSALELVIDPAHAENSRLISRELVGAGLAAVAAQGGGLVNWLVRGPAAADEAVAAELGMTASRRLLQMRRPLPTGIEVEIETRPFVVGADEDGWLEVNNLAFAGHGEQGGWTIETLRRRQSEEWFAADGVRIHERDCRIVAFCWTKVHPASGPEPELGEIYVIAVHPDHHGRGLGRQMTLAGLEHLARRGITTGMLWVDADNAVAVNLYERLGFSVVSTTVAFTTFVRSSG